MKYSHNKAINLTPRAAALKLTMKELKFENLDLNNDEDVLAVAKVHCAAPGEWNSDHSYSEECVARALDDLRNSVHGCHVVLVRSQENELVGMHWVKLEARSDRTFGNVVSLWVHRDHRRQGVATRLKELVEIWLRSNGASEIRTHVYMENSKMLALNQKLGYKAVLVGMAKDLK